VPEAEILHHKHGLVSDSNQTSSGQEIPLKRDRKRMFRVALIVIYIIVTFLFLWAAVGTVVPPSVGGALMHMSDWPKGSMDQDRVIFARDSSAERRSYKIRNPD
jgi:hypothetical protein